MRECTRTFLIHIRPINVEASAILGDLSPRHTALGVKLYLKCPGHDIIDHEKNEKKVRPKPAEKVKKFLIAGYLIHKIFYDLKIIYISLDSIVL